MPETTENSRNAYRALWDEIHASLARDSEAGRGPWLLTPAGLAWLQARDKEADNAKS